MSADAIGTCVDGLLAQLAREAAIRGAYEMSLGIATILGHGRHRRGGNARQRRRMGRVGRAMAPGFFAAAKAFADVATAASATADVLRANHEVQP